VRIVYAIGVLWHHRAVNLPCTLKMSRRYSLPCLENAVLVDSRLRCNSSNRKCRETLVERTMAYPSRTGRGDSTRITQNSWSGAPVVAPRGAPCQPSRLLPLRADGRLLSVRSLFVIQTLCLRLLGAMMVTLALRLVACFVLGVHLGLMVALESVRFRHRETCCDVSRFSDSSALVDRTLAISVHR
jgi:hypothetical protein